MSELLEAAQGYAAKGWFVFPVGGGEDRKSPLTKQGLKDASIDPAVIQAWWGKWPDANIGIATEPSGLAVVDIDDPAALNHLQGDLPPTLTARTPRGGWHAVYAGEVKSTQSRLAPKVDTRGRGGYIVAPPSHNQHGAYEWVVSQEPSPVPAWIPEAADPPRPEPSTLPGATGVANDRWGQRILEAEVARIAMSVEGTRNAELFHAACNVFEAVKGGHLDRDVATNHITVAAERAGLPGWEIERTLDSAWDRTGERHPVEQLQAPTVVEPPPLGAATQDDDEPAFDLLSVDALHSIPPPRYLIDKRLPEGFTALIGQPKSGKTFTAIDWAATVAATQGPVIYFVGEGVKGFAQRVLAWQDAHPHADLSRLHVSAKVPRLMDPESVRRFYTTVRRAEPALIVVDTLSRATPGVNENDSENWTRVIDVFDQIRDAYDTSSLVVHHTNTGGQRPRGSNSLDGAVDAQWRAVRDDEYPDTFQLVCDAMKDDDEPPPLLGRITRQGTSAISFPSEFDRVGR